MKARGLPVPIRSRDEIGMIARAIRTRFHDTNTRLCPIVELVEVVARRGFEVVMEDEIGHNYGLTYPDQDRLLVRADVYDAACDGKGWAREVMAHELGHLVLHRGIPMPFTSPEKTSGTCPVLGDSEWQANTFSELILAPLDIVKTLGDVNEISQQCGVTQETAFRRWVEARCR